jgi:TonB-dependent SusC/RagA subfamily outer membrane receptor
MQIRALNRSAWGRRRFLTKTLLVMKLTSILILAACLQVSANAVSQTITFKGKDVPLQKIFSMIKKQTGFAVMYNADQLEKARPVTINVTNVPLEGFLQQVLHGQPFGYSIENTTIFISTTPVAPPSDRHVAREILIDIRGRVLNMKGEPLEAVSVSVKGTQIVTATDANGQFILRGVEKNATLVFTGVNVEPFETAVNGRSEISINLKNRIAAIEEVTVTTGYQVMAKERSAGSFSKPNLEIVKDRSTSMNILQRLDGLVAGLTVNNAPGSSRFLIRGLSTVGIPSRFFAGTNRNPLFVVDGIPMDDVSSINPQDAADITVLKDATAASIGGARASNRVIVITTKK